MTISAAPVSRLADHPWALVNEPACPSHISVSRRTSTCSNEPANSRRMSARREGGGAIAARAGGSRRRPESSTSTCASSTLERIAAPVGFRIRIRDLVRCNVPNLSVLLCGLRAQHLHRFRSGASLPSGSRRARWNERRGSIDRCSVTREAPRGTRTATGGGRATKRSASSRLMNFIREGQLGLCNEPDCVLQRSHGHDIGGVSSNRGP